jgi:integrase
MGADGRRKVVRLGKATEKMALAVKIKVEALAAAKFTRGTVDDEVSRWVADLPDDMQARLAAVGLVEPREATRSVTLGELLTRYSESRTDIKPGTALVHEQAKRSLLDYFGPDKPVREIHEGDAELWRAALVKQGLSPVTVCKRSSNARQFFAFAIRQRLVASNPFSVLKTSTKSNDSRLCFVSQADFQKVVDEASDTEWKLILALARYGGLRTPSETLALRWEDVNWEKNTILVRSCKTERHAGGESRLIPLFAELRPFLLAAFEEAPAGAVHCIERQRLSSCNLRTQAQRFIVRTGLKPWPRVFQNLRASRETELSAIYPLRTVTSWLGNSQPVAMKHYLSVRDEDFERAAHFPAHAAQNEAQSGAEEPAANRQVRKPTRTESHENADMLVGAGMGDTPREFLLAPRGFEPLLPG